MAASPTIASARGQSKSPKLSKNASPRQDVVSQAKADASVRSEASSGNEATKPLAPPPRPGTQSQQGASASQPSPPPSAQQPPASGAPDYFAAQASGSLSLEPNPFEQSFGGSGPETPGGTKLPSVAALTSPSSLLPGSNATPFNWGGGSLRTGPLSPAMLSGPASDYFGDSHHLRGGFPTPNESSLRSGLTPGGSGSMFPAPSPNSQALFAQLASGGATPSTLDFHRTALSAAAKREHASVAQQQQQQQQQQQPPQSQPPPPPPHQQQQPQQKQQQQLQPTPSQQSQSQTKPQPPSGSSSATQPPELTNGTSVAKSDSKTASGPFDPHDNDAANGLFMLAQGRNGTPSSSQFSVAPAPSHAHPAPAPPARSSPSPPRSRANTASNGSAAGGSEGSHLSDEADQPKSNSRVKARRNAPMANGRRKADETPTKAPVSKKAKVNGSSVNEDVSASEDEHDAMKSEDGMSKSKMTEEEKRKNFLERNRVAALKCRQRKKQWLANLQTKVEMYSSENDALTGQIAQLREEVVNLKTLLLAHKDCPVTQQQGLHGAFMSQVVEPYNAQMNAYPMAAPMPNQQVMASQGVQRRFS